MQVGRWQCRPPFDAFCGILYFLWHFFTMPLQCKVTVRVQQFYLALIRRSQSMSVSLSSLCKWETWDMGRDSDWFRSAGNVKARNAILLLWVLSLLCGVLHDATVSVSRFSSPGAVTPGCPPSLMDLQSSSSRLDLNKELGRDVWLTRWFPMSTLSGWSPF